VRGSGSGFPRDRARRLAEFVRSNRSAGIVTAPRPRSPSAGRLVRWFGSGRRPRPVHFLGKCQVKGGARASAATVSPRVQRVGKNVERDPDGAR
jgi:hypothetical protein